MKKSNGMLIAAGVLSIITAVLYGIMALVMLIVACTFDPTYVAPDGTTYVIGGFSGAFMLVIAFLIIGIAGAIFCAVTYLSNKNKSYDELHQISGRMVTAIVFSFLVAGTLSGVFGIIGYINKDNDEQENITPAQPVEPQQKNETQTKLEALMSLRKSGVFTAEEYEQKRQALMENSKSAEEAERKKNDAFQKLEQLKKLKELNLISEEEFEEKRKQIVDEM